MYVQKLLQWNTKINLVSRKDEENIWTRHILGSISFLFRFRIEQQSAVIDVGTGGGLPGIPLAIMLPDIRVTMIDSIQKKILAVTDILSHLQIKNARAVLGRADEIARKKEFEHLFDYVIARAVAPITDIVKWTNPLLKQNLGNQFPALQNRHTIPRGSILLLKGGDLACEIDKANLKVKPRAMHVYPIIVEGIDASAGDLHDKKLVVIYP